ncbi:MULTISPECIES: hypothetical protein [Phyllobacteriaceae]|jgi:hypothetical protein|uniref:hypothetical protein n=1 Tax=Phyllobacteriaceae TaxID=69277 RepID=UPI000465EE19|nr:MULTISPECIES: hypothetical protein [Mesorhizobium]MBN9235135.1 hypothetical protein [Mesorhizobium sp.]
MTDNEDGAMTPEEHRLEDLKQMAAYSGPIVSLEASEPYYLASCDHCGWVGSSKHCGTDSFGDDSDVCCPRCHTSGADCGKVAEALASHPVQGSQDAPTHRHKKRGSTYALIGIGKMQAEHWRDIAVDEDETALVDLREVAIYRSVDDGSLWARPREEFEDGRFEVLEGTDAS